MASRTRQSLLDRLIGWLRAGYPDEGPARGHSALMALAGPIALTPEQTAEIIDELGGLPADPLDVNIAITKAIDRLPTPAQVAKIARELDQ